MKGTFCTVEGIDGAGKSSIVNWLSDDFDDVVTTAEPSEEVPGQIVRDYLQQGDVEPLVTFFTFMADRVAHIERVIKPALRDDKLVVSDRYADSSRAYQPEQLELDCLIKDWIGIVMEPWAFEPDLTLYLDISVDTALERCDREEEYATRENLEKVRENYLRIAEEESHVIVVDAERDIEEVYTECKRHIEREVEL